MKLPPQRVEAFLKRPDPGIRAVLLFGPDAGLVRERAVAVCRTVLEDLSDPFRVADLGADVIEKDPARLADEAAAMALTGGRRLIRVRGAGEATAPVLAGFLQTPPPGDSLVVVEAGELDGRSKLRAAFEAAETAVAIACYVQEEGDLRKVLAEQLRGLGLSIADEALDLLAANLVGDRMMARTEVDKLALYMGDRTRVETDDVRASVGDSADLDLDDPIWAAAEGDYAATDRALGKLLGRGESPVALLRAAQRHLQRLQLASARQRAGEGLEAIGKSLWGNIFFKLRPMVDKQLRRWTPELLARACERLLEAEADCKRTNWPDETICARAFFQVAQMARGTGGRR
ncbi:MAG TPA: DNA polymerase III subunit delta [Azospirillaceae bacterium]|nr:DNA polymerase III subunit delta [Azospirillaceae bacterium]